MVGAMRAAILTVVLAACTSAAPPPPTPAPAPGSAASDTYEGRPIARTMSYLGADWLDRPDREAREQPDKVVDALGIGSGMVVADVGAGTGYFTTRIARRVGATGKVWATDLQAEMLRMLDARLAREHLSNVELRRAGDHDAGLPADCCDLVLLVDVYHELADPPSILAGIHHALRRHGRLVLVEYRAEDPNVPIKPEHKMTLAQVKKELGERGFHFVDSLEFLPDQHVIIFTRDDE
jgi:ubiquinone/menaquinone biosynthesis C-methylase UbiE